MITLKKILLTLTAAAMAITLCCCSEDKAEEDTKVTEASDSAEATEAEGETEEATEEEVQGAIPLEYDGTVIPDGAAEAIGEYFRAIMNQDYEKYKACLDSYYFEVYNNWLDGNYGYGMETSFESMHQMIMDSACTADTEDGVVTDVVITKIALGEIELAEGETSVDEVIDEYLQMYETNIGEGFTEAITAQCDEIINVAFTMTADCDGTERTIMTQMEILMTVKGDEYFIMG